jgi:hypothetical protein
VTLILQAFHRRDYITQMSFQRARFLKGDLVQGDWCVVVPSSFDLGIMGVALLYPSINFYHKIRYRLPQTVFQRDSLSLHVLHVLNVLVQTVSFVVNAVRQLVIQIFAIHYIVWHFVITPKRAIIVAGIRASKHMI